MTNEELMDGIGQAPGTDETGRASDAAPVKDADRQSAGSIGGSTRNAHGDTPLSDFGAKVSSALGGSGTLKSLADTTTKSPAFDKSKPLRLRLKALDRKIPNYTIPDLSKNAEGASTDWRQLIIIGNGFDLQCGLRSRFGDFFNPRFDAISSIPDFKRSTWKELVESTDLTLWDFILEASVNSHWCDIEGTIERWVLSADDHRSSAPSPFNTAVEVFKVCPFSDAAPAPVRGGTGDERDDEHHMYSNMARYAWTLHPEIATDGYSHKLFMALLKQELLKLEAAFEAYLANEFATNETYAEKCRKLYEAIERDGKKDGENFRPSTSVLSFNYTDYIRDIFDGGEDGAFVNIHGKLGGEIIFGIDGKDCMDNPNAVSFTKTFRLMRRGGSRTDKLISTANSSNLKGATDVIKFYGHSLGKADYSYFQSIFDGVDLYESKTVLVFYYPFDSSEEGEAANDAWRNNLAKSINHLLVAYGATMDNSDHGKNLMHKLLLEGRLILRGLQLD